MYGCEQLLARLGIRSDDERLGGENPQVRQDRRTRPVVSVEMLGNYARMLNDFSNVLENFAHTVTLPPIDDVLLNVEAPDEVIYVVKIALDKTTIDPVVEQFRSQVHHV